MAIPLFVDSGRSVLIDQPGYPKVDRFQPQWVLAMSMKLM